MHMPYIRCAVAPAGVVSTPPARLVPRQLLAAMSAGWRRSNARPMARKICQQRASSEVELRGQQAKRVQIR